MLVHERRLWNLGFQRVAGMDEVGLGPWAGPVFAAAVILQSTDFNVRVDDSKRLTASARRRAFSEIVRKGWVGVGMASWQEVDHLGLRQAQQAAFLRAVSNLPETPDAILLDGPFTLRLPMKVVNNIRGDQKSLSIAAASIVAKVLRDQMMEALSQIFPGYGFESHKGYGTHAHRRALQALGPSPLHRMSFKPLQAVGSGARSPAPESPCDRSALR